MNTFNLNDFAIVTIEDVDGAITKTTCYRNVGDYERIAVDTNNKPVAPVEHDGLIVGNTYTYRNDDHITRQPDECNFDEHCIIDTWDNKCEIKVIDFVIISGDRLPVVLNIEKEQVSTMLREYIV